jgi:hypothetical protein
MSRFHVTFERPEEPATEGFAKRLLAGAGWARTDESRPVDPLLAFNSERSGHAERPDDIQDPEPDHGFDHHVDHRLEPWVPAPMPPAPEPRSIGRIPRIVAVCLLALVVGTGAAMTYFAREPDPSEAPSAVPPGASEGRAIISSSPTGALVYINDTARGATPIDLVLPIGVHTLQLQHGSAIRTLPLEIAPNQISSQYIELPTTADLPPPAVAPPATPPPARTGTTRRPVTQPAARVADTSPRPAPPVAQSLAPRAGSPPASAPVAEGWVSIDLPFPVQVTENGRVLGTIAGNPLKLPVGLHTLVLANGTYEFQTTLAVNIAVAKTTATPVTLPNGSLSVNALPWAEVFVDGRSIGTTPLANVPVPVGSHEILWRHPQFGDRRQTIAVTARAPVRIGTDFRR